MCLHTTIPGIFSRRLTQFTSHFLRSLPMAHNGKENRLREARATKRKMGDVRFPGPPPDTNRRHYHPVRDPYHDGCDEHGLRVEGVARRPPIFHPISRCISDNGPTRSSPKNVLPRRRDTISVPVLGRSLRPTRREPCIDRVQERIQSLEER